MIYLDKDLVNKLSPSGLLTYVAIRKIMMKDKNVDYISANRLCFELGIEHDKSIIDSLIKGLEELEDYLYIATIKNLGKGEGIYDVSDLVLNTDTNYFTIVYEKEIKTILSSVNKMDKKLALLKYFVTLIGTFNHSKNMGDWSGKFGSMPLKYISELAGISEKSAQRYNTTLEEMELIYIYRSNDKIKVDDLISQITNSYSRYEDKKECEEYAKNYETEYGYFNQANKSKVKKETSDNNRRLSQIYNQIVKGKKYSDETTDEVRQYIISTNLFYENVISDIKEKGNLTDGQLNIINEYKSKIRDVSVF